MVGKTINNYVIERKLGTGGMGEVYYAKHNKVDREVAIKVLHSHLFLNKSIHNRFKNEANALIKLNHPNIVKIFDYVEQENFACLIMEYINGYTLDEYIEKVSGPLPSSKATSIICNVLDAVQYAHDCNVYHRDIKPANIMISKDGHKVRVMDFGIAKLTDSVNFQTTHANTQLGTPFYMSPEQIKGLPYSRMSDIYSLGVTLFEMVTGKCPYLEITNLFDLQLKIVTEPLPPTSKYYPDVDQRIQNAISVATQKRQEKRFQNCNDFKIFLTKNDSIKIPIPQTLAPEIKRQSGERQFSIYILVFIAIAIVGIILIFSLLTKTKIGSNSERNKENNNKLLTDSIRKVASIQKADNKIKIDSLKKAQLIEQNRQNLISFLEKKKKSTNKNLTDKEITVLMDSVKKYDNIISTDEFEKLCKDYFLPLVIFPNKSTIEFDFRKRIQEQIGKWPCHLQFDDISQIPRESLIISKIPYNPQSVITITVEYTILDPVDQSSDHCTLSLKYKRSGNTYINIQ